MDIGPLANELIYDLRIQCTRQLVNVVIISPLTLRTVDRTIHPVRRATINVINIVRNYVNEYWG